MKILSALLVLICSALTLQSQVPTPAEFLGYELGDRFTRHHKVVDYAQTLSAGSDKASWVAYGKTSEYRDLGLLIIASPENQGRLEALREANLARAEGRGLDADDPGIVFVWLSYNVHGNEAVCTEAATAHHARSGLGQPTQEGEMSARGWTMTVVISGSLV